MLKHEKRVPARVRPRFQIKFPESRWGRGPTREVHGRAPSVAALFRLAQLTQRLT